MSIETMIPRWDMSPIYSYDSKNYSDALTELDRLKNEAEKKLEKKEISDFPLWLSDYIKIINKIKSIFMSLYSFAYAVYSTETTNNTYIQKLSTLEEKSIEIEQLDIKFRKIFYKKTADGRESKLEAVYARFPELEKYSYIFEEDIKQSKHQMDDELERIASELNLTGGESWSRLQEQIISNLKDVETGKTFNELRNDAYSKDPKIRKQSFEKEIELLKGAEIPLAACMNSIKGQTLTLNKRRNWKSAIEKSLLQARISEKTLNALIMSIEESLPMWRDYLKAKARILYPAETNSSLHFYDLFAPLSSSSAADTNSQVSKTWTFAEAKDYIIERFTDFSQDMGDFAKNAFKNNWIDAQIRPGKVGGAYCIDFPVQKVSRILSNFTGAFSDITTLAHELGHAYHFYCVKDMDFELSQYPMTLAETASNFAETIVQKDMIKKSSDCEKMVMIELHLQDCCQVLVDILSRFYFEESVFEKRASEGELSAKDFCTLMEEAQNKTYGPGLSDRHPYMWALKSHYYSTSLDFYNFPYAFGMLFSAGLYALYEKQPAEFPGMYKTLLLDTGRLSSEEVCAKAGFSIEKTDFWKNGIKSLEDDIKLFKEYSLS